MRLLLFYLVLLLSFFVLSTTKVSAVTRPILPNPAILMYGYGDGGVAPYYPDYWSKVEEAITIVNGTTSDAEFVKRLKSEGKLFAYAVSNSPAQQYSDCNSDSSSIETQAVSLADKWAEPFKNTLNGQLPGGFDAVSVDEFGNIPDIHHPADDGTCASGIPVRALQILRSKYPDKIIIVAGTWNLGDGGGKISGYNKGLSYSQQLLAIRDNVDLFVLENYVDTNNPQYEIFSSQTDNLAKNAPGLLEKTIFALYIAQSCNSGVDPKTSPYCYCADSFSSPCDVRFTPDQAKGKPTSWPQHITRQFQIINSEDSQYQNSSFTRMKKGIAFWVFDRSKGYIFDSVTSLVKKYYPFEAGAALCPGGQNACGDYSKGGLGSCSGSWSYDNNRTYNKWCQDNVSRVRPYCYSCVQSDVKRVTGVTIQGKQLSTVGTPLNLHLNELTTDMPVSISFSDGSTRNLAVRFINNASSTVSPTPTPTSSPSSACPGGIDSCGDNTYGGLKGSCSGYWVWSNNASSDNWCKNNAGKNWPYCYACSKSPEISGCPDGADACGDSNYGGIKATCTGTWNWSKNDKLDSWCKNNAGDVRSYCYLCRQ